jgi:hypothetical protein
VLVCDWLHSVGQNHFYVMFLFNQGYRLILSLLFRDVLQVDSAQIPSQRGWIPRFCLDVPVNRPNTHQSSNIRPNFHQCPEALNCSENNLLTSNLSQLCVCVQTNILNVKFK